LGNSLALFGGGTLSLTLSQHHQAFSATGPLVGLASMQALPLRKKALIISDVAYSFVGQLKRFKRF
jgi:hypothetical protein